MKKCRPVVKGPSGGTLLFCFALPARGASKQLPALKSSVDLCLGAACTGCISAPLCGLTVYGNFASALPARGASEEKGYGYMIGYLCLGAACTGCIYSPLSATIF